MTLQIGSNNDKGFTIVEVLLVIIILSIIAVISVVNFTPVYAQLQLKQTKKHLSYLMRYAQSRAVTKNRDHRLVIDSDKKQYWLEEKNQEDTSQEYVSIKGRLGRTYTVGEKITVESRKENIMFYPDGTILKTRIYVCQDESCFTISTKEQRGFVHTFEGRIN